MMFINDNYSRVNVHFVPASIYKVTLISAWFCTVVSGAGSFKSYVNVYFNIISYNHPFLKKLAQVTMGPLYRTIKNKTRCLVP